MLRERIDKSKIHIFSLFIMLSLYHALHAHPNGSARVKYTIGPGIGGINDGVFTEINVSLGKIENRRLLGLSGYWISANQHKGGFYSGWNDQITDAGLLFIYGNQSNGFSVHYGLGVGYLSVDRGWTPSYGKKQNADLGLPLHVFIYKKSELPVGFGAHFFIHINSLRWLFGGGLNIYFTNIK